MIRLKFSLKIQRNVMVSIFFHKLWVKRQKSGRFFFFKTNNILMMILWSKTFKRCPRSDKRCLIFKESESFFLNFWSKNKRKWLLINFRNSYFVSLNVGMKFIVIYLTKCFDTKTKCIMKIKENQTKKCLILTIVLTFDFYTCSSIVTWANPREVPCLHQAKQCTKM